MLIGVVSEHKGKKVSPISRILRRGNKIEIVKNEKNPFETAVFSLPYNEKQLGQLSGRQANKQLLNAAAHLRESGASALVFSEAAKKNLLCDDERQKIKNAEDDLFFRLLPECTESLAKKCGVDLLNSEVCISSSMMDTISWYLSRELCFKTKNLSFCTSQTLQFSSEYAEFCREMGFYPKIIPYGEISANRADILIDINGGFAKIGRSVKLSGVGFEFETEGICVNTADIAACIGIKTAKRCGFYFKFGKNKLTLS